MDNGGRDVLGDCRVIDGRLQVYNGYSWLEYLEHKDDKIMLQETVTVNSPQCRIYMAPPQRVQWFDNQNFTDWSPAAESQSINMDKDQK